ncbi:hypothetical protein BBH99_03810 [Chryseobacterium contaminans]|uniref:VanZ like family protein n=1 Tax=Chryseobacterium contaminans TaxID=1423959 RepID=A0ABX2X5F5_9FLAO|nr:hypothetical protein BBH99_03810 [Chryseobacterium contaminans]
MLLFKKTNFFQHHSPFVGLVFWEVIQYFMGSPMDIYDILMTASGCILTAVFILTLYSEKFSQKI